jgi:uncharacterized protein YjiS (DUF1127 family)
MKYLGAHRSKYHDNGLVRLKAWLRIAFTRERVKKENQRNRNELQKLSNHLLDDLGFTSQAEPLCWSSYAPKKTPSISAERVDQRRGECQNHCHSEKAIGCLS